MPDKHLHIVAFNVPYPADYGGVIDVYHKIRLLHRQGVKIHLHCFEYGRTDTGDLKNYCLEIRLYKRKTGIIQAFNLRPYIVQSRHSIELISHLLKDDYPILFEGLHSCYYLNDKRLKNRIKIYRESNIEHKYYFNLFKIEKNIFKKAYFLIEAVKLYFYQDILRYADHMLVVSEADEAYLKKIFSQNSIRYIPSFHPNDEVSILPGKGKYVLYHGNLSVPENSFACEYLIRQVMEGMDLPFIVAGKDPPGNIIWLVQRRKNMSVIANPDERKMDEIIRQAHVHLLFTFQSTGLKLKLLNSLYKGRFHVVNSSMLAGTGLDNQCIIPSDASEARKMIKTLFSDSFTEEMIRDRGKKLISRFGNQANIEKLLRVVFGV